MYFSVVDQFSRYVKFYPLKSRHTRGVIEALTQYVTDFGAPHSIVLENGDQFTSQADQQFCQQHLMTLYYTTPYHPQGNVITERFDRTLKTMLVTLCLGRPLRWPRLLQTCHATMNAAVHTSTAQHPYFAFFPRPAPRVVGTRLPTITSAGDNISIARRVIK